MKIRSRQDSIRIRHRRVRRKISGSLQRPRMAIRVTNRHIYIQFVDDDRQVTLDSVSTTADDKINVQTARQIGQRAATAALGKGISRIVVDRGGHRFHGRVKAIVDAAVAGGLSISDRIPAGKESVKKQVAGQEGNS